MVFWEFLLQKEGDRSWLPLESPDVEILEGRYRIVARSSRTSTSVEICVIHQATEAILKRRMQKRSSQTNPDGLLVVVPFTQLQPGIWEFRCTGDLMADMLGEGWRHTVKLQVLSQSHESADDWDLDWQDEAYGQDEAAEPTSSHVISVESVPVESVSELKSQPLSPAEQPPAEQPPVSPAAPQALPAMAADQSAFDNSASSLEAEGAEVAPGMADISLGTADDDQTTTPDLAPQAASQDAFQAVFQTDQQPEAAITLAQQASAEPDGRDLSLEPALGEPDLRALEPTTSPDVLQPSLDLLEQPAEPLPSPVSASLESELSSQPVSEPASEPFFDLATAPSAEALRQMAEALSEQMIADIFEAESDRLIVPGTSSSSAAAELRSEGSELSEAVVAYPELNLVLDRDPYTAQQGRSLTITGLVELAQPGTVDPAIVIPLSALYIQLRDPQTGETVGEARQPLSPQPLPFDFTCSIDIPTHHPTHLILGDLQLWVALSHPNQHGVLTSQSFTVTTDLDELLEAIANDVPETEWLQPPLAFAGADAGHTNLNLAFLDFLETPSESPSEPLQFQPATKQVLPPQLQAKSPAAPKPIQLPFTESERSAIPPELLAQVDQALQLRADERGVMPQLISFTPSQSSPPAAQNAPAEAEAETETTADVVEATPASNPTATSSSPLALAPTPSESAPTPDQADRASLPPTDSTTPAPAWLDAPTTGPLPLADQDLSLSPEDLAFRSLNLQTRFWSRINALAEDQELGKELSDLSTDGSAAASGQGAPLAADAEALIGPDAELAAQEIVVDDDPDVAADAQSGTIADLGSPFVLEKDEPVPTPELYLPPTDLVAGKPVVLTVTLPNLRPRIYVKVWIHDRQTRSVLDGPHWLVDFIPNSQGKLESGTQMIVPFGCLAIQMEAIAVEMATQKESHKVSLQRSVLPPNVPREFLDELDL